MLQKRPLLPLFCVCLVYRELRILVQATHTLGTPNCVTGEFWCWRRGRVWWCMGGIRLLCVSGLFATSPPEICEICPWTDETRVSAGQTRVAIPPFSLGASPIEL